MTGIPFRFLAQVHDEVDLSVKKCYSSIVASATKSIMEKSVSLGEVPVEAEIKLTARWYVPKEKKLEPIRRFDFSEA